MTSAMTREHTDRAARPESVEGLQARGIVAGYRGVPPVLDGVDLTVAPGRVLGLTGPSGVGKTTLARVITGLLTPAQGEVSLDGAPLRRRGRMGGVAMLFQSPRRSCDPRHTLADVIAEPLRSPRRGRPDRDQLHDRVREQARLVGLTDDLLGRLPRQVSDGQLQRAALARALIARPAYLVCDEATAMLDAAATATLAALLRDQAASGMGVLAVSHDHPLLAAWADDVVDIRDLGRHPATR